MSNTNSEFDASVIFGKSQFRGRGGEWGVQLYRWYVQFTTLLIKHFIVLTRRPLQLSLFLLLPSSLMLAFLLEMHGTSSSGETALYDPIPIAGLGKCDAYYGSKCVQVVYGPSSPLVDTVMEKFSSNNALNFGEDVQGFSTVLDAQEFVAEHIGMVQFTVFFRNDSLWVTSALSPDFQSVPKNMSYVIFYNNSQDGDPRSSRYNVNFPMLVLQKSLDEAYLQVAYPNDYQDYLVDFGVYWQVPLQIGANGTGSPDLSANTTACGWEKRSNMDVLGVTLPKALVIILLLLSNIPFQLIAEEKRKKLFSSLRRIGLMDSAYWSSWFVAMQLLLLGGCGIALLAAMIVRTQASSLRAIDLQVFFLILWTSGTAFISLGFFLAAFCSSSSVSSALAFSQFLVALATLFAATEDLNYYSGSSDSSSSDGCYFVASSYNKVYSKQLPGNTFVEFLVFFLPWFHSAQAITNVLSVAQYKDQRFSLNDLFETTSEDLVFSSTSTSEFTSPWVSGSLTMLMWNTVVYLFLAWLAGQLVTSEAGEGRSILSVVLPSPLRKALLSDSYDKNPQAGDIRGEEREKSRRDRSIRAYKVSKTYSGVQALKELSFSMLRGEVFVLLGHNGAGKSTLINIVTGLIAPTHGKVYINGYDAETDVADVQQIIGVCPQDDVLWDELTAREHMYLTAAFKGLEVGSWIKPDGDSALKRAIDGVLGKVQLLDRAGEFSKNFSGGMKRRLSVAMSTVGDVDVLFLDEPTTGLDPLSRRHVWDTITWMKEAGRVVVLTTHNMEEADFLADNIMIIHNGQVRAFGDPLFLKETYGRGYQLNLVVRQEHAADVTKVISQVLPNSIIGSTFTGAEMVVEHDPSLSPIHEGNDVMVGANVGGLVREHLTLEDTVTLFVTVPRGDRRGFPRLFSWLEGSRRAKSIVKEWGISNTTLEEVFLQLCAQNREVNYVSSDNDGTKTDNLLCPMCRTRRREEVVCLRSPDGMLMMVPDAVCWTCAQGNENFAVADDLAKSLELIPLASPGRQLSSSIAPADLQMRRKEALNAAHSRSELAVTQAILARENSEEKADNNHSEDAIFDDEWQQLSAAEEVEGGSYDMLDSPNCPAGEQSVSSAGLQTAGAMSLGCESPNSFVLTESPGWSITEGAAHGRSEYYGSAPAQVKALFIKNIRLQFRQKCSNCCSVTFVGVMFLMLYLVSLFFVTPGGVEQCDQGYLTDRDCSMSVIVDHIFSGDDGTMSNDDWADDDNELGPFGYNIQNYLVPSQCGSNVQIFGCSSIYCFYGLPCNPDRPQILWTSLFNSSTLYSASSSVGLQLSARYPPGAASKTETGPNNLIYETQLSVEADPERSSYPLCQEYAPSTLAGTYTTPISVIQQNYSDFFSDASFLCTQCESQTPGLPFDPKIFFDGTLWVSKVNGGYEYCDDIDCALYPYGYMSYKSTGTNPSESYFGDDCPAGFQNLEMNYNQYSYYGLRILAMTWLNLLSNNIADPQLQVYPIQTGVSQYGELNFDAQEVSQGAANILTLLAMLLMNGFWPMAVWRLSVERSQDIVLMMRTVGMRPSSYIFGMFAFDMMISVSSGVAMIIFAVQLELSQFDGAPIDYLVFIVILSAWALNASVLLLVRLLGKHSSILPLVAPCILIAATAGASLINVFAYPDEGSWPSALSIFPFFAQGRALYLILVYHQSSSEVNSALLLMFFFGLSCLIIALVLELDVSFEHSLHSYWEVYTATFFHPAASEGRAVLEPLLNEPNADDNTDSEQVRSAEWRSEREYIRLDQDVAEEKHRALLYNPAEAEDKIFAIVIQKLSRKFQCKRKDDNQRIIADGAVAYALQATSEIEDDSGYITAIRELSLALKYGECFGLLGPNGAGKSTTMSILSATLKPSSGSVFLAGHDLLSNADAIHKYVGVCPQFDIVWQELSVFDHLSFQARQRGIPVERITAEVQQAAAAVGLDGDGFHTLAGQLSGGMRRRLSIAMSIVGDPPIVFMDEPTTGLDPDNRQHIWRIIQNLKSPNRLILMTTHSMEEAEALCSRIGIVAKGELRCVGSAQHLKTKYGKGYVLTINLNPFNESNIAEGVSGVGVVAPVESSNLENIEEMLTSFVVEQLGHGGDGVSLISSVNRTKKYLIEKSPSITISEIFRLMELNKSRLNIREWGLSMSTLEDAFISAVEDK